MNKRGELSSTMVWFLAFVILFVILMVYILWVGIIVVDRVTEKKQISYELSLDEFKSGAITSQNELNVLLNSPVTYSGRVNVSFKFLLIDWKDSIGTNEEEFYKKEVEGFLGNYFPNKIYAFWVSFGDKTISKKLGSYQFFSGEKYATSPNHIPSPIMVAPLLDYSLQKNNAFFNVTDGSDKLEVKLYVE